jgi:hypothetical protein
VGTIGGHETNEGASGFAVVLDQKGETAQRPNRTTIRPSRRGDTRADHPDGASPVPMALAAGFSINHSGTVAPGSPATASLINREPQTRQIRPLGRINSACSRGAVTLQTWQWIIFIDEFELIATARIDALEAAKIQRVAARKVAPDRHRGFRNSVGEERQTEPACGPSSSLPGHSEDGDLERHGARLEQNGMLRCGFCHIGCRDRTRINSS